MKKQAIRRALPGGVVGFEIIGGLGERFLDACAQAGLPVREIRPTPTGYTAQISARHYRALRGLARASRCRLRVRWRKGLCFALMPLRGRVGIALGLVLAALLLSAQRGWIWRIDFYDFTTEEQQSIRAQMYEQGIYEGVCASDALLERAADQIFIASDAYSWVRFNFVHGRLVVEKVNRTQQPDIVEDTITDVVAISDGIIVRQIIMDGFGVKQIGQSVAAGEVLISGSTVGSTGITLYAHAMGEVYARVEKTYVYTQPWTATAEVPTGSAQNYHTLLLPEGHTLALYRSTPPQTVYGRVVRTPVTLWGLCLPATLETWELRQTEQVSVQRSPQLAAAQARLHIYDAIQAELGTYEILQQSEQQRETEDGLELTLRVTLVANIGRVVPFGGIT